MQRADQRIGPAILIVALHAIFSAADRRWYGVHTDGDDTTYEDHLRTAPELAVEHDYDAIILSGGLTRPHLPEVREGRLNHTEAQGARQFLEQSAVDLQGRSLFEENYARCSWENLFNALLCTRREMRAWPSRIGVISFDLKLHRFTASAVGLGIVDRFQFHGIGGLGTRTAHERVLASEAYNLSQIVNMDQRDLYDPLHRGVSFREKRATRMNPHLSEAEYLQQTKQAYIADDDPQRPEITEMLDRLHSLRPGPEWRSVRWPWNEPRHE